MCQNRRLIVREYAEEVGICKRPCHLILTDKLKMRRVPAKFVPRLLTDAFLIREFLTKHETTVVPPSALLSKFGPCGIFLVPEIEILTERSPISDDRGARRKFDTEPSRHPAKHVPGRVIELEKSW